MQLVELAPCVSSAAHLRHALREAARHDAAGHACGCSACGGLLRQIGQDVSEQLEYVPSRFKVVRHVRPKLACMACESIFQVAAPNRPIARGIAGPGLLAHVLVAKYCDHQPLYRQSRIYAREGVSIERATMAGWVGQSEKLLDPLVAALGRYMLAGAKLRADDTPVAVLSPGRGKTETGRLWVYVRDDRASASADAPAAWLRYSPDRKGEHPQAHLKNFKGEAACVSTRLSDFDASPLLRHFTAQSRANFFAQGCPGSRQGRTNRWGC